MTLSASVTTSRGYEYAFLIDTLGEPAVSPMDPGFSGIRLVYGTGTVRNETPARATPEILAMTLYAYYDVAEVPFRPGEDNTGFALFSNDPGACRVGAGSAIKEFQGRQLCGVPVKLVHNVGGVWTIPPDGSSQWSFASLANKPPTVRDSDVPAALEFFAEPDAVEIIVQEDGNGYGASGLVPVTSGS
jgi:hypothetical protein